MEVCLILTQLCAYICKYCLLQPFQYISSAEPPHLDKMPDTGPPINLKIMLDTAVMNCSVKNWSIYEEHGGMTFKIRFRSIDNSGQSLNGMCGSFARKPPSKQNRDKKRATSFRT